MRDRRKEGRRGKDAVWEDKNGDTEREGESVAGSEEGEKGSEQSAACTPVLLLQLWLLLCLVFFSPLRPSLWKQTPAERCHFHYPVSKHIFAVANN